jgi:capsular exopolysaccharide synthesis family protein
LPHADSEEYSFLNYAKVLWRRKLLIIVIVAVAIEGSLAIDNVRPKVYGADASMQLISQNVIQGGGTVGLTPTDIATDIQLVQSAAVKAIVTANLGQPAPKATVTEVGLTEVLNVHVSASNAAFAARTANEYVSAYIKFTTDRYAKQTQQQMTILGAQKQTLQAEIGKIETQIAANSVANASNAALNTQLDNYASQLNQVNTSLMQLQLDQTQVPSGALPVSPVPPNKSPISPKPLTDAVLAGLLGLIVSIGLALTLDFLDDRIRTKEQLHAVSGRLPLLGEIPLFKNWKDEPDNAIIAVLRPKSAAAEAYRSLRTAIQFIGFDSERANVIQITSPMEGEGKTTTVIDLAVTMASSGTRVVVVSCDLRKPGVHKFFKTDNTKGLSSVLGGTVTLESVVAASEEFPNLTCIPSGPIPPNPSELLGSPKLAELFESLRSTNDVILVDSPPVLPVTDAIVVAQVVDVVVLLSRVVQTRARAVAHALELLSNVDAPVKGTVLNAVTVQSSGGRYGRYERYGRYGGYGS